jgi:hypothetical protein
MDRIKRESRSIKIQPAILRKAHIRAIESGKTLGEWLEEAIKQKIDSEPAVDTHTKIESDK